MRSSLHQRVFGPETQRVDVSRGPALGVAVGMLVGLAFWLAVIALAYAVMVLA